MRVRSFEFEAEPCEPLTPASVVNRDIAVSSGRRLCPLRANPTNLSL